jgi:hypothetical protein
MGRQINILFVIKTTGFVLLLHSLSIGFVTSVERNYAGCFLANCSSIKVPLTDRLDSCVYDVLFFRYEKNLPRLK